MPKTKSDPRGRAIQLTKFWQELGPNTYPLDIENLIEGTIQRSGFSDQLAIKERPFDNFEGALVRTEGVRKWTILLNTDIENARRRRFTFAHELGHFMCHRNIRNRFEDTEENLNDFRDTLEAEANLFASWLLMPANLVRDEFLDGVWNAEKLRKIGTRFECSLQASALRFIELSDKPIAFVVSRDGMIMWAAKSASAPFMNSYKFGDVLPPGSAAEELHQSGSNDTTQKETKETWAGFGCTLESQYLDHSGQGYHYTCIEFI